MTEQTEYVLTRPIDGFDVEAITDGGGWTSDPTSTTVAVFTAEEVARTTGVAATFMPLDEFRDALRPSRVKRQMEQNMANIRRRHPNTTW